jgi:hypothetical protein
MFSEKEMEKINEMVSEFGDTEALEALENVSDDGNFTIYKSTFWTVVVQFSGEMKSGNGETLADAALSLLGWLEHDEMFTLKEVK